MTNEEKAKEIADYYTDTNDIGVALNSAKEMAEWKDQQYAGIIEKWKKESEVNHDAQMAYEQGRHDAKEQFKEYLEKKKRCLSLCSNWSAYENTIYNDCLAEIINDIFKED